MTRPDPFLIVKRIGDRKTTPERPTPPEWFDAFPRQIGDWERKPVVTSDGEAALYYSHPDSRARESLADETSSHRERHVRVFREGATYVCQQESGAFSLTDPAVRWADVLNEPTVSGAVTAVLTFLHEGRVDDDPEVLQEEPPAEAAAAPPDQDNVLWPNEALFDDS